MPEDEPLVGGRACLDSFHKLCTDPMPAMLLSKAIRASCASPMMRQRTAITSRKPEMQRAFLRRRRIAGESGNLWIPPGMFERYATPGLIDRCGMPPEPLSVGLSSWCGARSASGIWTPHRYGWQQSPWHSWAAPVD